VSGLTDSEGMLHQSYRYDPFGGIDFGKPQYNNVYAYNAESYNGNTEHQYLRARYYDTDAADFLTEDSYLGKVTDPLTLNRYNYVKSSPLNYIDPSGHRTYWDEYEKPIDQQNPYDYNHTLFGAEEMEAYKNKYGQDALDEWIARYNQSSPEQQFFMIKNGFVNWDESLWLQNQVEQAAIFLNEHTGAALGLATGVIVMAIALPAVATTSTLATVLYVTANLTAGGGIGVFLGGSLDKGLSRSNIQKELKQKYNLDVNTQYISIYQMEDLPQEAVELCELYNKYGNQEQKYTEVSQAMMAAAMLEYLAAYAAEVYGTNLETMLRNWVRKNNEGTRKLNSKGVSYPEVIDPRTGKNISMPKSNLKIVPKDQRVEWNNITRSEYIKEWYDRGYQTPTGGWEKYDIHHILPREYGGTNVFDNLVPVDRTIHQTQFNPWWASY